MRPYQAEESVDWNVIAIIDPAASVYNCFGDCRGASALKGAASQCLHVTIHNSLSIHDTTR